jgi:hypothetical protein
VVGNSGVLLAREHGALIDAHDLVIWLNNAPAGDGRYARHMVCVVRDVICGGGRIASALVAWFAEVFGSAARFAGGGGGGQLVEIEIAELASKYLGWWRHIFLYKTIPLIITIFLIYFTNFCSLP